jgi:uncharacterized membrane protein (DUF373 family)
VARLHRYVSYFESVISAALMVMVAIVVLIATFDMAYVIVKKVVGPGHLIESFAQLPEVFGIFLLVLIGLELLETLKSYNGGHRVRVTMVLLAALIALARKIIIIEPDKYSGETLLGMAALIVALGAVFFLLWRTDMPDSALLGPSGQTGAPDREADGDGPTQAAAPSGAEAAEG